MQEILFFVLAGVAVLAALAMIVHKNPVYSVLLLIVTLFCLAGIYVLLNAPFVAAVHMIVYAGAIVVLFLFVIMLLDLREDTEHISLKKASRIFAVIITVFVGIFITMLFTVHGADVGLGQGVLGDTASVGKLLFTKYVLQFEIASVLLLAAIVGAVVLAKKKLEPTHHP